MTKLIFGIPFDDEIFIDAWHDEPDVVKNALVESGALVVDPLIQGAFANKGNLFSIPYYKGLTGDEANYDGQTDVPVTEIEGDYLSGVAYGRTKGFKARDFVADLSGADPLGAIARKVAKYWQDRYQSRVLGILNGCFDVTAMSAHTVTATELDLDTFNNAVTEVLGANKHTLSLVYMHSTVATQLENMQLLEFWKYNDASGMQRKSNLATYNGWIVVVDDQMPVKAETEGTTYDSYVLGDGVLRTANAKLSNSASTFRDEIKNGGEEYLITRIRESIHPNGFSFKIPTTGWTESPTDAQLFNKANWELKYPKEAIPMVRVKTTIK